MDIPRSDNLRTVKERTQGTSSMLEHVIQIHVLSVSTVHTVWHHTCVLACVLIKVTDTD